MKIEKKERKILGLNRNVFYLGVVSFLTDASSEMIYPLIPLFLVNVLGVNKAIIGLIEGIAESTASLLKVFSGWLSDRLNKRKALIFSGYGLSTIGKPFLALATSWTHVLAVRFVDRVGKGIRTAPRDAIIADSAAEGERGKAFGFHRSMDTLGAALGPFLAFIFLPIFLGDYRKIFLLSFIPALLAVLVIVFFVREKKKEGGGRTLLIFNLKMFDRDFKIFLLIITFFTLGNSSDAFIILRAENLGIRVGMIPIVYLLFNLVYSISATPAGIISDRIGRRKVIVAGLIVFGLVYLGFAFSTKAIHMWILFSIYGLYHGLTQGVLRAFASDLLPSSIRATGLGMFHTLTGIAVFPASLITGILWQAISPVAAFSYGAIMALLSAFLLITLLRR